MICSVVVNYFILTNLKNLLDWRQFLDVMPLLLQGEVVCEKVVGDAQVHALLSDVLDGLRGKRLLALVVYLLLLLSIDFNKDGTRDDSSIYELDVCVVGMFVYYPERRSPKKKVKLQSDHTSSDK